MLSVPHQLDTRSPEFETGAVAGLSERRKLCLAISKPSQGPAARRRAVLGTVLHRESVTAEERTLDDRTSKQRVKGPCSQTLRCRDAGWRVDSAVGRGAGDCSTR